MKKPADKITAAQLADILGTSARTVGRMAAGGKIPFETVNGRGDRRFSIHKLLESPTTPIEYKISLVIWRQQQTQDESPTLDNSIENPENLPVLSNGNQPARIEDILQLTVYGGQNHPWQSLPEACRDEGLRLYKIVEGARKIKAGTKKGKGRSGALGRYAKKEGVELKTLYRWVKKADRAVSIAKNAGESDLVTPQIKVLAPKYGRTLNRFRSWSVGALKHACSLYLRQSYTNISDVYKEVSALTDANNWQVGSYRSLVTFIGRIDKSTVALARQGKKKFEAARVKKILRNYEEIPPNFMFVGDHHIYDNFVKIQDSKGGWKFLRPWVTGWMDVRSRSLVGWTISFKPNSQTIAMALAHAISDKQDPNFPQHGLPNSVYVDNGKDYRSQLLNGELIDIGNIDYPEIIEKYAALGIDPFYIDLEYDPKDDVWKKRHGQKDIIIKGVRVGGVYAALGIHSRFATVYSPWAKLIERFFRNVVQSFSRSLPGWCGSTPDQRPEKLATELKNGQLLTFEEFTAQFYNYIVNDYHKHAHRGHGMNGRTPDEVFQELLPQPKTVSQDLLDFALARKSRVKIHSWGFQVNNRKFELDIPTNLYGGHVANCLIDEWVQVFYDYDFKTVRVFKDGRFICNAKSLQRASYVNPDCPIMVDGLKLQAHQRKAAKAVLDAIRGEVEANKPVSETQALLEISNSLPFSDSEDTINSDATVQALEEDYVPIERTERYQMILDRLNNGGDLTESDIAFKEEYEKSEEYLSYKHLFTGTMG